MNRVGEVNYNNFGSKMIIVDYRGCNDIDVYFPQYNWTAKNRICKDFKSGKYLVLMKEELGMLGL